MKKLILVFYLIIGTAFAQKTEFKGKLLDEKTQKPIAYVNISFLKKTLGISTIEDGTFSLKIDTEDLNSKIHISCLNYKDTLVFAKDLHKKTIFLKPKSYSLDEVVISKKLNKEVVVDNYKRRNLKMGFTASEEIPWIVAKFFQYKKEYKEAPFLKNLKINYINSSKKGKVKFRIRLLSIDKENDKPLEDILFESLLVEVKKGKGEVKIDLSEYDLEFPEEGFFVGIEWLRVPSNFIEGFYFDKKKKKKIPFVNIAPVIKARNIKNAKVWTYSQGKWEKNGLPVPAISVTLSN